MDKKELRHQLREKLAAFPKTEAALFDTQIISSFLTTQVFMPHTNIACYMPLKGEVGVMPILQALTDKGHQVCLPAVVGRDLPMVFLQYKIGDKLLRGKMGALEPEMDTRQIIPDVLVIPMMGFNRKKYRLGYGSGYYDRTLEELRRLKSVHTIGLAYSFQEVAELEGEAHDVPLDIIITEKEIIT